MVRRLRAIFNIHVKPQILIFLLTLNLGLLFSNDSQGQQNLEGLTEGDSDSLSEESWSDETYYWIEKLRLDRWLRDNNQELSDSGLLREVVRIKKEAEVFAEKNDFTLAVIWLETIWELIKPETDLIGLENEIDPDNVSVLDSDVTLEGPKKFNWSREIVTGVDLWRQQFEFAFVEGDSTFLEGNGNPYTGVRLNFDYGTSYQNSIQGYTFFKYSRDYLSGEADFRLIKPLSSNSTWKLQNRFEGTSFYKDFNLKYLQNASSVEFDFRSLGAFSLEIAEEFILRRYDNENSTYPNYFNNTFTGFVRMATGVSSFIGVGYRNIQRFHPKFQENDYQENRVDFTFFQTLGYGSSFSLENKLSFRNYTNIPADTSFQFDYWEEYLKGTLRVAFSSTFGTEFRAAITKRDYQLMSAITPDYLLWEVEPELYFNLSSEWRINLGFFYSKQTHEQLFNRSPFLGSDAAFSIPFEDYYNYGPIVTIEFFRINGLLFSIRESFLIERYPNSLTRDVQSFNLYSDRNINSIMVFLTWNISSRWQLGVLANMDDDRSQKNVSGDSQNTIVGIEFNYFF
jgi:hypothetical protein